MQTLWHLIEHRGQESARRRFLRFEQRILTFGDLHDLVRTAAGALRKAGIMPGNRVLLMMRNHPEHVITYLALNWLDCVAVEVSIHLKSSGIELQMTDARADAMILDPEFEIEARAAMNALPDGGFPLLVLDHGNGSGRGSATLRLDDSGGSDCEPVRRGLDAMQAISYTSGTTGRSKGVMMTERYFQLGAQSVARISDLRQSDVLFLWEPFYHVAGWMSVIASLQHGAPLAMVDSFSASRCWDQIRDHGATLFHYLGGAMNLLLRQPPRADDSDNPVRIAWGAAAPADSWTAFESRFGVTIREGYGISEAQNFTHLNLEGRIGSMGRPIEAFEAWIEDTDRTRLPPGKTGEIVLRAGDPRLASQGYFNDPARTRDLFRDGCIRTGDLGHTDADGYFYYAGRLKDSLRRRGENVSAWEVERILNAHPSVAESAVVGVASEMGEQDIRAFVRPVADQCPDPIELIRWCEARLAYYQIPRYIDFVEDFPKGPTQRIQKSRLPTDLSESWDLEQSGFELARNRQRKG